MTDIEMTFDLFLVLVQGWLRPFPLKVLNQPQTVGSSSSQAES